MSAVEAADARAAMDRMYRRQRHIYDLTRKFYLLGRDELIAGLGPPPGGTVLEIACGTGRNLIRAARLYPQARFHGFDVSEEMLATACANVTAAGLRGRIALARADATAFDPRKLFGVAAFDRVFVSYALSMIPPWREAAAEAAAHLAPGGALHVVDFGDGAGLPAIFRAGLRGWLARFDVTPRHALEPVLRDLAAARGLRCAFRAPYRRYAFLATLTAN
ncbi:MAG: class I SAM-dependent methyltransferase [Pseudomonadota bacterium]|nr:class I SAM-dependent methyltransferase [Pseudomonadota bacterium]